MPVEESDVFKIEFQCFTPKRKAKRLGYDETQCGEILRDFEEQEFPILEAAQKWIEDNAPDGFQEEDLYMRDDVEGISYASASYLLGTGDDDGVSARFEIHRY